MGITDAECLWRPAPEGLHVQQHEDGCWRPDWPDNERYDIGPPSIAWLTWHIVYWWSMALSHSFGDGTLTREDILWPGTAAATVEVIRNLHDQWRTQLIALSGESLRSVQLSRFPFEAKHQRAFADGVAWVNMELTKNCAELGYARFLFAVNARCESRLM